VQVAALEREQVEIKDEENEHLRLQLQEINKKLLKQTEDHEVLIIFTYVFLRLQLCCCIATYITEFVIYKMGKLMLLLAIMGYSMKPCRVTTNSLCVSVSYLPFV